MGLAVGLATAVAIGAASFFALQTLWPAYAAAVPDKSFTLSMLMTRLLLGVLSTAAAACVATRIAMDDGRTAWRLGVLFLAVSLPNHMFAVWDDYPAWYHVVYLGYLVPIAGLTGQMTASKNRAGIWKTPTALL